MKKINTDLPYFIDSYSVNALIDKVESVNEDAEISWNSFGGSVYSGQQFADFMNNKENKLTANVSGIVASMGSSLLPFFDHVKGAKQSDVMIHSASGGGGAKLSHTNKFLYNALAKKINEEKFEQVTGHKLKTVMLAEGDQRFNVWITGKQAGEIGLFDETYDLLDKNNSLVDELPTNEIGYEIPKHIAEKYNLKKEPVQLKIENVIIDKKNNNDMDIKDVTKTMLISGNPEVYNSIIAEEKKAEQERVKKIFKYAKYDFEKAEDLINSGTELSTEDVEHFMEKKFNREKVDALEDASEDDFNPAKKTLNEDKEKEAALEEFEEIIGIGKETLK